MKIIHSITSFRSIMATFWVARAKILPNRSHNLPVIFNSLCHCKLQLPSAKGTVQISFGAVSSSVSHYTGKQIALFVPSHLSSQANCFVPLAVIPFISLAKNGKVLFSENQKNAKSKEEIDWMPIAVFHLNNL